MAMLTLGIQLCTRHNGTHVLIMDLVPLDGFVVQETRRFSKN
jgi:hypothetical protein